MTVCWMMYLLACQLHGLVASRMGCAVHGLAKGAAAPGEGGQVDQREGVHHRCRSLSLSFHTLAPADDKTLISGYTLDHIVCDKKQADKEGMCRMNQQSVVEALTTHLLLEAVANLHENCCLQECICSSAALHCATKL